MSLIDGAVEIRSATRGRLIRPRFALQPNISLVLPGTVNRVKQRVSCRKQATGCCLTRNVPAQRLRPFYRSVSPALLAASRSLFRASDGSSGGIL